MIDRTILASALTRAAKVIREDPALTASPQGDFFWSVLPAGLYDVSVEPELSLGSLDEAAHQLEDFVNTDRPVSTNDLVWIADTLRAWAYSAAKH